MTQVASESDFRFLFNMTRLKLDEPSQINCPRSHVGVYSNITTRKPSRISFAPSSLHNIDDINGSLPSLDDPELSLADRLLLASTKANLENSSAQYLVSKSMQIECVRKALPKITKYKGDAKNWLKFKKDVQRYREIGQYDDEVLKLIVFGALEGNAESRVKDLIDNSSLDLIMEVLEVSFGHAPSIISACEDDILKFKIKSELTRSDAVQINTLIQTYMNACSVAGVATLNSNMLANHILRQLNSIHKLLFRQHYKSLRPEARVQIPDLDILLHFFGKFSGRLRAQVHVTSTGQSNNNEPNTSFNVNKKDDYKFIVSDNKTAKFIGYDLALVKSLVKKCLCCNLQGHFTLECQKFKSMTDDQRLALLLAKTLVHNKRNQHTTAPISSAKASNNSATQAQNIAVPSTTQVESNFPVFTRQMHNIFVSSSRTVKMFKHIAYGPRLGATIYSIGDSASEITLMRDD
ncbi:hypothetical protein PVAND_013871 [Polypedilum vanderplanki]|uniref:Uncharacterized protein n=1 Tax=Polypedilum vanderplanki TaxID=319348 RepID=A0A9J6CRJ7_POLVA|nr:hypothetical protein PVAND_013871 [Polypedilum vanderplanki]